MTKSCATLAFQIVAVATESSWKVAFAHKVARFDTPTKGSSRLLERSVEAGQTRANRHVGGIGVMPPSVLACGFDRSNWPAPKSACKTINLRLHFDRACPNDAIGRNEAARFGVNVRLRRICTVFASNHA